MDTISKATDDALKGFIALGDAAREELTKRAVKAKPAHDINVRRLNMKPDDDGDYGFPAAEHSHGIRVFHEEATDGRDLPRLMRAVDLAPCMADFVKRCGRIKVSAWPDGMLEQWCWLKGEITGVQTTRTNHTDAARAAGWIE